MTQETVFNAPEHLNGKLKVNGTLAQKAESLRKLHASQEHLQIKAGQAPYQTLVWPYKQPALNITKEAKATFQSNDYNKIKSYEDIIESDIQDTYNYIIKQGDKAWMEVEASTGEQYYMVWTSKAFLWSYCQAVIPSTFEEKTADPASNYQAIVQYGIFSKNADLVGVQSFRMGLPSLVDRTVPAFLIVKTLTRFIEDGLQFDTNNFPLYLTEACREIGLPGFSFGPIQFAVQGAFTASLIYTITFVGLKSLTQFPSRQFTLRTQFFNWNNNDWLVVDGQSYNLTYPGKNTYDRQFNFWMDKIADQSAISYPPGAHPGHDLDIVVSYLPIVYQNDGLYNIPAAKSYEFAIRFGRDPGADYENIFQSFTYAYNVPHPTTSGEKGIYLMSPAFSPAVFLDIAETKWEHGNYSVTTPKESFTPISAVVDHLFYDSQKLFSVNVHIDK